MDNYGHRGTKIARNTLMLYVRMLVLMLVGLYTSRVVLGALGEDDFGVYNVVGGVVSMFTIISGALNSAVSRFITFEMGKGADAQLNKVYSTAVTIQLILAAVVVLLAEPLGLWFIDNKMTIDPSRIPAARWVLHFSLLAFVINLMSVPQMASITAHEHMSAYAYIGILDGLLRLGVAFLILHSPIDRLIFYAALMAGVVLTVRLAYGIYCRMHFEECRYRPVFDRPLIREMFSFAGWNFIGVTSGVLRDHGGNILVNLFSDPAVNAARGVAVQLNGAVQGFVTNFMTAVNPQITKSYAAGEKEYMFSLVRRSSRMSFFLLFLIALPVIFNADYLLSMAQGSAGALFALRSALPDFRPERVVLKPYDNGYARDGKHTQLSACRGWNPAAEPACVVCMSQNGSGPGSYCNRSHHNITDMHVGAPADAQQGDGIPRAAFP